MHFVMKQKILFKHCDPAGIVFFPRYFEIINDAVETMFSELMEWPFEELHRDCSVPTVAFNVEFKSPSFHGEMLEIGITIKAVGRSSMTLQSVATGGGQTRLDADQTIVLLDASGRPRSWPDTIREKVGKVVGDTPSVSVAGTSSEALLG